MATGLAPGMTAGVAPMPVAGVAAAPPVGGVGSGVWRPPCPCWVASTVSAAGAAAVGVSSSSSPPQLTSSSALSDSAATAETRRPCKRSFRPGIVTVRHPPKLVGSLRAPGGRHNISRSRVNKFTISQTPNCAKGRTRPRQDAVTHGARSRSRQHTPPSVQPPAMSSPWRGAPRNSPTSLHDARHRAFTHRVHSLHRSARRG